MKRCPRCQNVMPLDARFCMQCGLAYDDGQRSPMPRATATAARKPWWLALVLGILLLAGLG